jgi:hypothetical protein
MRIYRLTENDFDKIIEATGGKRLITDNNPKKQPNADYILGDAIIELKFTNEEGLEKKQRQQQMAKLFRKYCPDKPTVVIDPKSLGNARNEYYEIISTPIKKRIKKAAKQLKKSINILKRPATKVLILINNGYGSLYHNEFKDVAFHCVTNVTTNIDHLIIGGIYFYSDKFDSYVICPFELIPINIDKKFNDFDKLKELWNNFIDEFMTSNILKKENGPTDRLPVIDIVFQEDGIRYIKPAPLIGRPSEFWVNNRPRENSTGIQECPPVAITFPKLDKENWQHFKNLMPIETVFGDTYQEWLNYTEKASQEIRSDIKPLVPIYISYKAFVEQYKKENDYSFRNLCRYTSELFEVQVRNLINSAFNQSELKIILPEYLLLVVEEIGQDKANDMSSIYHIKQSLGRQTSTIIVENKQIFFEYGLALTASYALKYNISQIIYNRDQKYMWK